jgi:fatty-acyl-CoA synthase
MFHVNAWGTPYAGWLVGTDIILPQMYVMGEQLGRVINDQQPTLACGVPTIWNGLLGLDPSPDMSTLRAITSGGAAVPRSLLEAYEDRFGLTIMQGWGMTETSPMAALAKPPHRSSHDDPYYYRVKAGRIVPGVEVRVVAEDGTVMPNDGESLGEFEIRGPWVTGSYYKDEDPAKFHDGWLRTGDIGTLDAQGYMTISDRTKDVIKSGGEWISSVELENEVMSHPDVFEAAVIAIPDPKWSERPLVCVVPQPGTSPNPYELTDYLKDRVTRWWLPDRWCFVDEIPKTSVGKFDKKVLRARYADGDLTVATVELPQATPS